MMSHFFFAFKSAFFFDFVRYFHQRGRDLRGEGRRNERARFFRSLLLLLLHPKKLMMMMMRVLLFFWSWFYIRIVRDALVIRIQFLRLKKNGGTVQGR